MPSTLAWQLAQGVSALTSFLKKVLLLVQVNDLAWGGVLLGFDLVIVPWPCSLEQLGQNHDLIPGEVKGHLV